MNRLWSFIAPLLATSLGAACAVQGPVDVEALVADGNGTMVLDTTTLRTVTDLYGGTGEDFDVVGGLTLTFDFVFTEMPSGNYSFDEMVEKGRQGSSNALNLRMAPSLLNGRYESEDFDTLMYLTVFSNVEKAWAFFRDDLGDTSGATRTRGLVGLYGSQVVSSLLPVPVTPAHDNAAYVPIGDVFYTLRVHDQEGIPLGMSQGVIAHEFAHRIFFHNVVAENAFDAWKSLFTNIEVDQQNPQASTQPSTRDQVLMRGVDEGLADVFAVMMVQTSHFTEDSFMDSSTSLAGGWSLQGEFRDLDGDFAEAVTYEALLNEADDDLPFSCGRIPGPNETEGGLEGTPFNPYCLGVLLAKTVYDASGQSPANMRNAFGRPIIRALGATGRRIQAESDAQGSFQFETEFLLNAIATELEVDERLDFCAVTALRFSSLVLGGLVPACL